MKVLAIDTSTSCLSIAIVEDGGTICECNRLAPMQHSSLLLPMMADCLKRGGLSIEAIDGFAVSLGPGSFTGLRIGVATMKGLAFALSKPIVGISTLDVLAENIGLTTHRILPILDAKRGEVYSAIYGFKGQKLKRLSEDLVIDVDGLLKMLETKAIFLGEGLTKYQDIIKKKKKDQVMFAPPEAWFPRASVVARYGLQRLKTGKSDHPYEITPLYHRRPEAEEKIESFKG